MSKRVLIVDDMEPVRETLQAMIEFCGFEAVGAESGKEAIEKFKEAINEGKPFSLVVLDLLLPEMSGIQIMQELKKINPEFKAIISSGYSDDPAVLNCEKYGFSGVLNKPYTFDELKDVLAKIGFSV